MTEEHTYVLQLHGKDFVHPAEEIDQVICVLAANNPEDAKAICDSLDRALRKAQNISSEWYSIKENIKYPNHLVDVRKLAVKEKKLEVELGIAIADLERLCQKLNSKFKVEHKIHDYFRVRLIETVEVVQAGAIQ